MEDSAYIRKRLVCLRRGSGNKQAAEACEILRGINGVIEAQPLSEHRLRLTYSLQHLTFELIEDLLRELGFRLDGSVFAFIRRSIYQYLEDNAREKIQVDEDERSLVCQVDPDALQDEPEKYWNNYR